MSNRATEYEILAGLPTVRHQLETLHRFLSTGQLNIVAGGQHLIALLETAARTNSVLAISQFGYPIASFRGLAAAGVPVGALYWSIDPRLRIYLTRWGVQLINAADYPSAGALMQSMSEIHSRGIVIALFIEAPMRSRRRFSFMGYEVQCSSLLEVYANKYNKRILPILTSAADANNHVLEVGPYFEPSASITTRLLNWLEAKIIGHPRDYRWPPSSIVFSDERAILNGLKLLPQLISWRDKIFQET